MRSFFAKRWTLGLLLMVVSSFAIGQSTPAGLWRTIDDKTKVVRSQVRIVETNGEYEGKIEKIVTRLPDDDPELWLRDIVESQGFLCHQDWVADMLAASGAKWVKEEFRWETVQPARDRLVLRLVAE